MKKVILFSTVPLLLSAYTALAAPQATSHAPMTNGLNLTPEQERKINQIKQTYQEKIRKLIAEGEAKMMAVLTPEQKKKLEEMKRQRQAMMQRMHQMMQQRQQQAAPPQQGAPQ